MDASSSLVQADDAAPRTACKFISRTSPSPASLRPSVMASKAMAVDGVSPVNPSTRHGAFWKVPGE